LLANTPTCAQVSQLLDGITLEEAAVIPDTIKQWDTNGVDNPKALEYFSARPKIAEQLRAFWTANPPTYDEKSPVPSHHWFHYTDVPLAAPRILSVTFISRCMSARNISTRPASR